jgi:hypothetical protein
MRVRRLVALGIVGAAFAAAAAPAQAINDARVPANECSNVHSVAVGDPLNPGNPGINFHTPQVSPPVSASNPGVSTGALGQIKSPADNGVCHNS